MEINSTDLLQFSILLVQNLACVKNGNKVQCFQYTGI